MIDPKCFSAPFLREVSTKEGVQDVVTMEKCVLALHLVTLLQRHGLNFIFKGGTSLLLHCPQPKRLSIDVDIISIDPLERLEEVLTAATASAPFTRWEHQTGRDREAPPTKHFKVFYPSSVGQPDANLQLDVIACENPYHKLEERIVSTSFLELSDATKVSLPCASSLLADKVATFAPTTIGYPYKPLGGLGHPSDPRPIKVVKHLFDIGELAPLATDLEALRKTYASVHAEQTIYRNGSWTIKETLQDTRDAAYNVCRIGGPKQNQNNAEAQHHRTILAEGIKAIASHLFSAPFSPEDAQVAASRAALAAALIERSNIDFDLPTFLDAPPNLSELTSAQLTGTLKYISKPLKQGNIEAFNTWNQTQRILEE